MTIKSHYKPGTYGFYQDYGRNSARLIRSVRSGGYRAARKIMSFYSRASWQDCEARRAVTSVKRLGNPKPYFFRMTAEGGMLYILSFSDSIKARKPRYIPARGFSPRFAT